MTAPRATRKRVAKIRENLPAPNTPEGEHFHYNPDEAAPWTPFSGRTLRDKIGRREIPFVSNGRHHFLTGRQIVEISERYVVKPFSKPSAAKPARAA